MKTKVLKFSLVLSLVFQGSAFAQITEQMKAQIDNAVLQYDNALVRAALAQTPSLGNLEGLIFDSTIAVFPELNNPKDQAELKEYIVNKRKENHALKSVDGSWESNGENAIFTIHGKTATMTTNYNGCTEIQTWSIDYSSPNKFVATVPGPWETVPAGCHGGSAPICANKHGIEYGRKGSDITFTWSPNGTEHITTHFHRVANDAYLDAVQSQRKPRSTTASSGSSASNPTDSGTDSKVSQRSSKITFVTIGRDSSPALKPGDSFYSVETGQMYTAGSAE